MDTLSVQAIISARDAGYKAAMADAISQSQQLEKASESCAAGISKIAIGNVVAKGVTAAFSAITNAIGGAVKRIDTLNNFKPVMESLGYSATEAEASINKLSEGIDGLPTTLDGIVSSAQMLTASLDDLGKGTEAAIALNDMFLAGGQGAEAAARGLTQYNQMLAKGKVDQQSWNTLVEVAPGQLKQLATELVGASASQKDLYDALQSGKISMEEFNNTVIRLDQEGGQGFQSFADQARAATGGIATAWQNVQTAVVKGVASVIDAVDKAAKEATGSGIADAFNSLKDGIKKVFDVIAKIAAQVTKVLAPAFQFLGKHIKTVVKVLGTIVAGFAAFKIITAVKSKIEQFQQVLSGLVKKRVESVAVTTAETTAETANAGASTADAAAKTTEAAATNGATTSQEGLNAAMAANPIGIVIAAVVGLISVLNILADAFSGLTDEEKKAKEEEEAYLDSCQEVSDSVHQNAEAAKKNAAEMEIQAQKIDRLVGKVATLNDKEELSAEEKEELATTTATLNNMLGEHVATIDKETGKTKESTQAILDKCDAYKQEQRWQAVEDNYNEALEKQIELEAQEEVLANKVKDARDGKLAVQKKEKQWYDFIGDALYGESWAEQQAALAKIEGLKKVQDEYDNTKEAMEENDALVQMYANRQKQVDAERQAAAEAEMEQKQHLAETESRIRQGMINTIADYIAYQQQALDTALEQGTVTLDMLSDKNQQTVQTLQGIWQGYVDSATDMFNKINETSELSAQQMIENMQHNAEATERWGQNMRTLRDRLEAMNLDEPVRQQAERMLQSLQESGTQSAGAVNELANMTDAEMQNFVAALENGAKAGTDAFFNSMSEESAQNAQAVEHLITDVQDSLNEQVAAADWREMPKAIMDGLAEGFNADDSVVSAAVQMAERVKNADVAAWGIGSPSKVYEGYGNDINQGLTNGIARSASNPINTAQQVAEAVMNATKVALSNMFSVGVYAMQGFVNGLRAMAGTVMATAASIANSAAATIKSALKVSSPSKVLAQIGEWTGEGFVIGLKGTENAVRQTMDQIADITAGISVPNLSSRTFRTEVAFAGTGYTSEIGSLREEMRELRKAVMEQPINVATDLRVDGRSFARATATYTKNEIEKQERLANNLGGIK